MYSISILASSNSAQMDRAARTFTLLVVLFSIALPTLTSQAGPLHVREEVPIGTVVGPLTVPPEILSPAAVSSSSVVLALTRATPGARFFTLEAASSPTSSGASAASSAGSESGSVSGSTGQQGPAAVSVLKVAERIDRDTLCQSDGLCCEHERFCTLPLVVAAQVGAQRPTFTASVVLEDENDNVPAWPPGTHELTVSVVENSRTNTEIPIEPLALDADSRAFTITRYELVPVPLHSSASASASDPMATAGGATAGSGPTTPAGPGQIPFELKITRDTPPLGSRY